MNKLIIISAPSGTGKSTIINYLLEQNLKLEFSISATSRLPRGEEVDGKEYYFLSPQEFRKKIENDQFVEYVEVYKDRFYGTLKSEVDRISAKGCHVIFDLDVIGALQVKECYEDNALAIFIKPPSIEELQNRLTSRGTDTMEVIETRLERAEYEISVAHKFDKIVVNDSLEDAEQETLKLVKDFLAE